MKNIRRIFCNIFDFISYLFGQIEYNEYDEEVEDEKD